MQREIQRDEQRFVKHYNRRPRHTMQLDFYVYEHDLRKQVIPQGQERARRSPAAPPVAAGTPTR
jgi:hypothetical protein